MQRTRDDWLRASDREFLSACRVETMRGSGRGGQKRNVTDSAVRITHEPSGCTGASDATRSQTRNRRLALRAVRHTLALECRCAAPPPGPVERPGSRHRLYPLWIARVLDVLSAVDYRVSDAAAHLETSTGRLVRDLASDPTLWQVVASQRRSRGHPPLRRP